MVITTMMTIASMLNYLVWLNVSDNLTNETQVSTDKSNYQYTQWRTIITFIITITLTLITAGIFTGNLLIILAFVTTGKLRRITDQYLVSLATADFLVSVFVLPFAIIRQHLGYWPFKSSDLCYFYISMDTHLCMASIFNLCCISLDRYIAISQPMKNITRRNRLTSFSMILFAWVLPLPAIVPPLIGSHQHTTGVGNCYLSYDKNYRIYSTVLGFFVPLILLGFVNFKIYYIINNRMKAFENISRCRRKNKLIKLRNINVITSSYNSPPCVSQSSQHLQEINTECKTITFSQQTNKTDLSHETHQISSASCSVIPSEEYLEQLKGTNIHEVLVSAVTHSIFIPTNTNPDHNMFILSNCIPQKIANKNVSKTMPPNVKLAIPDTLNVVKMKLRNSEQNQIVPNKQTSKSGYIFSHEYKKGGFHYSNSAERNGDKNYTAK
ncbi:unnamed protein product [Heterobilharzia americana]|nr:unnamed protein product [Heterobilharzia americana]